MTTMADGGGNKCQQQHGPSTPLVTVSGDLAEYLLDGHLSQQMTGDLARESIDWMRSQFDITPVPVYVEAQFVRLDQRRHWLWDTDFTRKLFQQSKEESSTRSSHYHQKNKTQSPPPITSNNQQSSAPIRRHHSFNVNQNSIPTGTGRWSSTKSQQRNRFGPDFQNLSSSLSSATTTGTSVDIDYQELFRVIGQRYLWNDGARILLNSYWIDAGHDLESYNAKIRDDLLEWFQKILTVTAAYHRLGLNHDFEIDFFIVIVIRNRITPPTANSAQKSPVNQPEQLLNLSNLETQHRKENRFPISSKMAKIKAGKSSLSASLSSLNSPSSMTPTIMSSNLNPLQLADQIRNDLLVQFQLFRQDFLTRGHPITATGIPANNNRVVSQLLERVIIFDSTSNSSDSSSTFPVMNNHHSNTLTSGGGGTFSSSSTNPIISSTARTFSALSQFSASKMNPMSPTKARKTPNISSSGSSPANILPSGGGGGSGGIGGTSSSIASLNYTQFIMRIRAFLLDFYTRQFECFERLIRTIRELRLDPEWDYFGFFLLQEELAFGYESLGLYSKSLVQYDELDALFSQSIQNGSSGFGGPRWLRDRLMDEDDEEESGRRQHHAAWNGLCLCNPGAILGSRFKIVRAVLATGDTIGDDDGDESKKTSGGFEDPLGVIGGGTPLPGSDLDSIPNATDGHINVLDFRNYLYARQCHLLCMLNKPWELARRALPFLQNSVTELSLLDITVTPGGVACWVFMSALEILHKCERYSDSSQLDSYSYHTVGLWSYARENLIELGQLCNLMPGSSSETTPNLHRVVELIAGMGADPHVRPSVPSVDDHNWMSPQERLKDALSSPEAFIRHYLEITELTMGTYKHIGHIRFARYIGKQLAQLYLKLNKPQQALPFLLDLYHMFQTEHWPPLKREACRLLAQCLEQLVFQVSNHLTAPEATAMSLEPIIRSAVRTVLLLFVVSDPNDSIPVPDDSRRYLDSLRNLLSHYQKNGVLVREVLSAADSAPVEDIQYLIHMDRPLLTVHNRHSDLLHDGPGPTASTVSLSTNSSSNSDSNLLGSGDQQESRHRHRSQTMIGSNESIGPNRPLAYESSGCGDHIFRVESLDFRCCTAENIFVSGSKEKISASPEQSFIAGSLLSLQMRIQSELRLPLVVERAVITLECQTEMVPLPSFQSEFDGGEYRRCCGTEAQLEALQTGGMNVGIRCLNVNRLLKRSHDGVHRFLTQLPISLLNQRLSNEDYHRYFRFLSAKFRFETDQQRPLVGDGEFELQFQSPANLETAVPHKNRHLNHVWFRLDQMVLFCRHRDDKDSGEELQFAILDDFRTPIAFRLVKCPPSVELMPRTLNHSNQLFIGIEEPMVLRLNSGTSTLPKGLRCRVKISQVNDEILGAGTDPSTTIMASLYRSATDDDPELVEFYLDHPLEPFQTYELDLVLRSRYAKPKTVAIHGNQRPTPKIQDDNEVTFEFRLTLAWQEEAEEETPPPPETVANCHFILCDPFHVRPRIHTAGPDRKLLQIHLHPSVRLPPFGMELWFRFPRVEITDSGFDGAQCLEPLGPADPAGFGWHRLTAQNQLSFLWLYQPPASTMKLDLEFVAGSVPADGRTPTVNVTYQIRVMYDVRTRYTIRQWIEPLLKPGVVKNSEIIRIGTSCLFRVKIDRISNMNEDQDDEYLMYELVCDPDLWSFVSNYRAIEPQECDSEESSSLSPEDGDGPISMLPVPQPSSAESMVIKFSRDEDRTGYETCFEVMPLTPGHIPLPAIRISIYIPNDSCSTVTAAAPPVSGPTKTGTKTSSAIESISAKLSENLSLSGKNWSKYLSPGGGGGGGGNKLPPETETAKTARLKPFEPGQVYNYNRSSQVYVLPSVTGIGPE